MTKPKRRDHTFAIFVCLLPECHCSKLIENTGVAAGLVGGGGFGKIAHRSSAQHSWQVLPVDIRMAYGRKKQFTRVNIHIDQNTKIHQYTF